MKRIFFSLILLVLIFGCRKNEQPAGLSNTDPVSAGMTSRNDADTYDDQYYVTQILYNDSFSKYFAPYVEKLAQSTKNIYSEIYIKGGIELVNNYKTFSLGQRTCGDLTSFCLSNNIDTTVMMDNRAEIFASWGGVYAKMPGVSGYG